MRSIDPSVLAAALSDLAFRDALLIASLTIIAAPAMKYFARQIPFLSCALIVFVTAYVVSLLFFIGWMMLRIALVPLDSASSGVTAFAAMFVTGWLINRYVARNYGIPIKFPSLGFKVMLSTLATMWLVVGILFGLSYLLA